MHDWGAVSGSWFVVRGSWFVVRGSRLIGLELPFILAFAKSSRQHLIAVG